MSREPTIPAKKKDFLRSQKRVLSQDIAPSQKLYEKAEKAGIRGSVINDVVYKVNRELKRQTRLVYSDMSMDAVAEQIDAFYWNAGAPDLVAQADSAAGAEGKESGTLYVGDDLSLDENISKLSPTWDASTDPPGSSEDADVDQDTYMTAVTRLQDLSAKRLTLQQKLTTCRTLLSLLKPYRNPQGNVQPNLVTRDAPLATELVKTRTLAIRVVGRVGEKYGDVQVPATEEGEDSDTEMVVDDGNAKLGKVLSSW
ncbi:hypothetical protein K469DRAFT_713038 [Zopfia rhizophila CBS 207.26]|uniref:Kinetochore protein fta4 n=1 Tax=Zopfia rhizophila CBS 207.26 TaxID=1314779 RepID=A0A6A6DVG9_9PEZI|nr:hypothetical protein K469DRAFT_713038 [Zopfia rhizophila CBS 207.26]